MKAELPTFGKSEGISLELKPLETWLSGRKRHPAKVLGALPLAGSNPVVSAKSRVTWGDAGIFILTGRFKFFIVQHMFHDI